MKEREKVELQRAAFVEGNIRYAGSTSTLFSADDLRSKAVEAAAEMYPLLKTTRPRRVKVGDDEYSVEDGKIIYRQRGGSSYVYIGSAEVIAALKDILNNPTEEVDCDC